MKKEKISKYCYSESVIDIYKLIQKYQRNVVVKSQLWPAHNHLSQSIAMTNSAPQFRIGNGYDIHRLVPSRHLIIGGVKLDHPDSLGLDGHSDADVLVHAVMDAMLGALSLGDIGKYFPPENPKWKGSDSLVLLESITNLIKEKGWEVINIDSVIVAERPKLKPHIDLMRGNIAQRVGIGIDNVAVKATTNELLGPEGREEGISSHAVVLLGKP